MKRCLDCAFCEAFEYEHPYFGVMSTFLCTNVLDDEVAELPMPMLTEEQKVECFTFRPKGYKITEEKEKELNSVLLTND